MDYILLTFILLIGFSLLPAVTSSILKRLGLTKPKGGMVPEALTTDMSNSDAYSNSEARKTIENKNTYQG